MKYEYDPALQDSICGLDDEECKEVERLVVKDIPKAEKLYTKYRDIHDSGEASSDDVDNLIKYENRYNCLCDMRDFLKQYIETKTTMSHVIFVDGEFKRVDEIKTK